MVRAAALLALLAAGCRRPEEPPRSEVPHIEAQPVVTPIAQPDLALPPLPSDESFTLDIKGQLDRIAAWEALGHDYGEDERQRDRLAKLFRGPEKIHPLTVYGLVCDLARDEKVTYPMLKKNAARYAGRRWATYRARVLEIHEANGVTTARLATCGSFDGCPVFVAGRFETPFVEGDRVDAVGYLAGAYSYTSQAGWQLSIPALAALAIGRGGGVDAIVEAFNR